MSRHSFYVFSFSPGDSQKWSTQVSENVCPVKKHTYHTGPHPQGKEPPRARMQNTLQAFLPQAKLQKLYPGDAAFFQNCVIIHREVHSQVSDSAWSWAGLPRAAVKRELATRTIFMVSSDLQRSWVCAGDGAQAASPAPGRPCLLPSAHNRDQAHAGLELSQLGTYNRAAALRTPSF